MDALIAQVLPYNKGEGKLFWSCLCKVICIGIFNGMAITIGTSLFLAHYYNDEVRALYPWVYMATAVFALFLSSFYGTLSKKLTRVFAVMFSEIGIFLLLLLIYYLIFTDVKRIYFLSMITLQASSLLLNMCFYSFIGDFFTLIEAKRLYSYFSSSMALSYLLGGQLVAQLSFYHFELPNLLFVAMPFLFVNALFTFLINFYNPKIELHEGLHQKPLSFKYILKNNYFYFLLLTVFCTAICKIFIDYQMMTSVNDVIHVDDIPVFLGKFYSFIGLTEVLIEFLVINYIIKYFGLQKALFTLPIFIFIASLVALFHHHFIVLIAINFVFIALSNVLASTAKLLYLPLEPRMRRGAQFFTEQGSSVSIILGALLLIFVTKSYIWQNNVLHVVILLSILWTIDIIFLQGYYRKLLIQSIKKFEFTGIDLAETVDKVYNRSLIKSLFDSKNDENIIAALNMLRNKKTYYFNKTLCRLSQSDNSDIAINSLYLLDPDRLNSRDAVYAALDRDDLFIKSAALEMMCHIEKERSEDLVWPYIKGNNNILKKAAIRGVWQYASEEFKEKIYNQLQLDFNLYPKQTIEMIGLLGTDRARDILLSLLIESDIDIKLAAIESIKHFPQKVFIRPLLDNLLNKDAYASALLTLKSMPKSYLPIFEKIEKSNKESDIIRGAALKIFAKLGDKSCINQLVIFAFTTKSLKLLNLTLVAILEIFNRDYGVIHLSEIIVNRINRRVLKKIKLLRHIYFLIESNHPDLAVMIHDDIVVHLRFLFVIWGVNDGLFHIKNITHRLFSHDKRLQSNVIELLPNYLSKDKVEQLELFLTEYTKKEFVASKLTVNCFKFLLNSDQWTRCLVIYFLTLTDDPYKDEIKMKEHDIQIVNLFGIVPHLKKINLFSQLSSNVLGEIASVVTKEHYYQGELLFNEGDPGDKLYFILSGKISIRKSDREIAVLGPGDCLGELTIINHLPRSASAFFLEESIIFCISGDDFNSLLLESPEISTELLRLLATRLRGMLDFEHQ